jgi:hypothetical protein
MTSAHTAYVFASYAFVAPIPPAYSLDSADSDAGGLTSNGICSISIWNNYKVHASTPLPLPARSAESMGYVTRSDALGYWSNKERKSIGSTVA